VEVRLSPWQTRVLDDPHRFKVINVGRRAGKTVLCVLKLLIEAGEGKRTCWYVAPTYKQAKNIAWSLLKEYCPPAFRAQWNETDLTCRLPNGSVIALKGADNPDSLRGVGIDFAVFDEVAFFADWRQAWEALRPVLVDSKAPAWFVSTPNGFNHFYGLYDARLSDPEFESFHYTSYDNPYLDAAELDGLRETMDARSFAQEFLAEFSKPSGTVYAEWDPAHFTPCPYDPNLPLHVSFDWGVNDATAMVWVQPGPGGIRVVDYYEARDANVEHYLSVLRAKPYRHPDLFTGDHAGNQRSLVTGTSVIDLLSRKGVYVRSKPVKAVEDRIRPAHATMARLFVNSDAPGCSRFRDCLLNYRYPEKKTTAANQDNEEPMHDEYSHGMNAYEYWCYNEADVAPRPKRRIVGYSGGDAMGYGRVPVYAGGDPGV